MTTATKPKPTKLNGKHRTDNRTRPKFPWEKWLTESSPDKPVTITFGKDVPSTKTPAVLTAQLHQWAAELSIWAYTSVSHDKKTMQVYGIPIRKGQERPLTAFPSPKKGTHQMAKKKAAPKKAAKSAKKASAKKAAKKSEATA